MAEIKWVKLATDIFSNRKIRQIEAMPEGDTMVLVWVKLLCLAGQINDNGNIYLTEGVPYTPESLAREFGRDANIVHLALETFSKFNMVDCDEDGIIHITSWDEYQSVNGMEMAKIKHRERQRKYRDKQKVKELGDVKPSVTENVTGDVTQNVTGDVTVTVSSYSYSPSISPSYSVSPSSSFTHSDSVVEDLGVSAVLDASERDSSIPEVPAGIQEHAGTTPSQKKETRRKYGEFQNVKLTDTELEKLQEQFPDDWESHIEKLSEYIACKGDKYKNHLAVIRSWARRDMEQYGRDAPPSVSVFRNERSHSQRVKDTVAEAMGMLANEPESEVHFA